MLNEERKELLIKLELLIGNECYNSNIQNYGPGGVWEGDGRDFRYPITFINENNEKVKTRYLNSKVNDGSVTKDMLTNGYYAFGANELHIMQGLNKVLDYLEKEYGLDINVKKETE